MPPSMRNWITPLMEQELGMACEVLGSACGLDETINGNRFSFSPPSITIHLSEKNIVQIIHVRLPFPPAIEKSLLTQISLMANTKSMSSAPWRMATQRFRQSLAKRVRRNLQGRMEDLLQSARWEGFSRF